MDTPHGSRPACQQRTATVSFGRVAIAFLMLVVLSGRPAAGQDSLEAVLSHFHEGNELYRAGDYTGALEAYQQVFDRGYESAALHYNMGNAYYRLGELGQAVRYYERARQLMPEQTRIQHNLNQVRSRTVDSFAERSAPFWERWWHRAVVEVGQLGFFTGGLFFCFLAAGLICYGIWVGRLPSWLRGAIGVTGGLAALLLVAAFGASLQSTLRRQAVVTAEKAPLHSRAQPSAASEQAVHEGLLLEVVRTDGNWTQVRLPNGETGWLRSDDVTGI